MSLSSLVLDRKLFPKSMEDEAVTCKPQELRSLTVCENWKDWQLAAAFLGSTSVLTSNSLLLHGIMIPSL